ncbi:MAG: cysteine desulfurase [Cognatishimia sp.]|uniref:cysteine desulfurase family protein n=1 Tax=Cognatishimia sp. TaxID=2211648 RepID=UPI003B8BCE6F
MSNLSGYFDYNATTPLSDAVKAAMVDAMEQFENPSAAYAAPDGVKTLMAQARADVAALIGADPEQIVFTSGATESNNWVLRSILECQDRSGAFVTSAIEHDATLASGKMICDQQGRDLRIVSPDSEGIVPASAIEQACQGDVSLVSLMLTNNETGAIQPVREVSGIARQTNAFFHVDAVQAAGKLSVDVSSLCCDSLSLSAHKFHGPKGVGALYIKNPDALTPMIVGGGQEAGLRAGTENIVGIAGMGAAAAEARARLADRTVHVHALRTALLSELHTRNLSFQVNGPSDQAQTALCTLNLSFPGIRAESLVARLGLVDGIKVSLGSACSTNKHSRHSHVLQAMGLDEARLVGSMRISFGRYTTRGDITRLAAALEDGLGVFQRLAAAE